MNRQWEWMFAKVGEVGLSITAMADSLTGAVSEANAGLQQFFTDMEQFQSQNRVQIQIDPFCHGHLASVTCPDCGADVTRLASQPPAGVEEQMVAECVCPPDDDEDSDAVAEQRDIEREARELYGATRDERLRALL